MSDLLQTLAESIRTPDEAEGRIYGFLGGKVTDVTDPKGLGRVRARIGAQQAGESSDWLVPLWPGGMEGIPYVGDKITVGFYDGDINRGFYLVSPTSKTLLRPVEHMLLGDTFAGLFNFLVTRFNSLQNDYSGHTHPGGSIGTGTTLGPSDDTSGQAAAALNADGSAVRNIQNDTAALSSTQKVR